jgi:predicted TPR repeat methyltransferase
LRSSGELEEAGQVLEAWLHHDPGNPVVHHMVAAFSGKETPLRASDDYVKSVFDEFAATYDEALKQLGYQGPQLIASAVSAQFGSPPHQLVVLDAGCGTGLCGPVLRPFSRQLIGVDLSTEMVERARERNVYDDVVVAELTEYMKGQPNRFDLIVAADTFNYFGALEEPLANAAGALQETGLLIFTLEHIDASAAVTDYYLNPHGRYGHTEDYIKRCAAQCNLNTCAIESVTLRKESGQPVAGWVVRTQKG